MRKINKIMMITVSVLLCLVLITSSAVSSTFAKYATSGSSSSSARVAKWGVVIEADYTALENVEGQEVEVETTNDGMGVSITGLKMGPGDDFSKAVKFTISGTPEVKLRVKIGAYVSYNIDETNNFKVPSEVAGLGAETTVIPFGFTFDDDNDATPCQYLCEPCASGNIPETIANGLSQIIDMTHENNATYAYKTFAPTDDIALNLNESEVELEYFYLGFKWPSEYAFNGTNANYNEVVNWLLDNKDPTFEIKYIVTVDQLSN